MFGELKSHLGSYLSHLRSHMGSRSKILPGIPSRIPLGIPPWILGGIPTNILHVFSRFPTRNDSNYTVESKIPPGILHIPPRIPSGIPLGIAQRMPCGIPTNILHGLSTFPSSNDSNGTVESKWLFTYRSYIFTFS